MSGCDVPPQLAELFDRSGAVDEFVDALHVGARRRLGPDHHEHLEVGADATEFWVAEALEDPPVAEGAARHIADDHAVHRCLVLQARGDIGHLAQDGGVVAAVATELADHGKPGVDGDPQRKSY